MPTITLNGETKSVSSDELLTLEKLGVEFDSPGTTAYFVEFPHKPRKYHGQTQEEFDALIEGFDPTPLVIPVTNMHRVTLKYGRDSELKFDPVTFNEQNYFPRGPFFASTDDADLYIRNKQAESVLIRNHNRKIKRLKDEVEQLENVRNAEKHKLVMAQLNPAYADIPAFKSDKPNGYGYGDRMRAWKRETGGKETLTPITDE